MSLLHEELSSEIIKAFFNVFNTLGTGFLEKVYENAMLLELRSKGINCIAQKHVKVFYIEQQVGFYIADIIAEERIIIEIKAAENICEQHEYQLINYLRATEIQVGLLLNFGKTAQFKRKIITKNPSLSVKSVKSVF